MCGISGVIHLAGEMVPNLEHRLQIMNQLLAHRGPDGEGVWCHPQQYLGLAHRRLSIIDLSQGAQPMGDDQGNWIVFNGEIYNYLELRTELNPAEFKTQSDTEVILKAYEKWGIQCLDKLRGMFAFALWDQAKQTLFCARDRFGIKPFYYAETGGCVYFASEVKALLPFIPQIETNLEGLSDYLTFQFYLNGKTLFKHIQELPAAHYLLIKNGTVQLQRYWQVYYDLDFYHTENYFQEKIQELLTDSVRIHLRSDVPVGAYISGGLDSSIIGAMANQMSGGDVSGFTGKFALGPQYDESQYARDLAQANHFPLHEIDIQASDFIAEIEKIIYHLDYPLAGPGSFPQYMVSGLVKEKNIKVVLGGQGGDEIFGGYVRYLIAYFEQCIKAAIEGTMHNGNFIVTYESILPNLVTLANYKPLLKEFWKEGLFDELDQRYFRLINRSNSFQAEFKDASLTSYSPYESFRKLFLSKNVKKESYFDSMTHFDFKTLLPSLLHVEDRMSMAHGIESRVPFLDHPLIELSATIPSNIKFKNGSLKYALKQAMGHLIPSSILERKDKMGFPVPLNDWLKSELKDFIFDIFSSQAAQNRSLIDNKRVLENLEKETQFGRKVWGLLCLELWQKTFHDQESKYKQLLKG